MRLDHLLSKELDTVGCENGWINPTKTEEEVENCNVFYCLAIKLKHFWCRCGWGTHPFPSRTRRLRPNRPMVLHWRRCGRAGGRQIKKKTTGWKPDEDKTGIGKWVLSETGWSQIRIVKSGANPYQPGRAVKICWFYQWLEILNKKSRRRNIWCF